MENEEYEPFGQEWEKQMKKNSKDMLIDMFKNLAQSKVAFHEEEVLGNFSTAKAIDFFGKDKILDEIGEDYVREYFGL